MIKYIIAMVLIINAASCSSEEQEAPTMEETTKMVTNQIKGAMVEAGEDKVYIYSLSELAESHATVQRWEKDLDEIEEKMRQGSLTPEERAEWEFLNAKRWVQIFHWNRSLNHHIEECKNFYK